jgi:hypothetical protein
VAGDVGGIFEDRSQPIVICDACDWTGGAFRPARNDAMGRHARIIEVGYTPFVRSVFIRVILVEAAIIVALWFFGRAFS